MTSPPLVSPGGGTCSPARHALTSTLRARYYVGSTTTPQPGAPLWVATELIFPIHEEDAARGLRSYRIKHRDKAMQNAIAAFHRRRDDRLIQPGTGPEELPNDLVPIARYFARRFQRNHLLPHERIVRTEIWQGIAANPPRLAPDRSDTHERRLTVLRRYHEGPIEQRVAVRAAYPVYHAGDQEADIRWVLDYFEGQR